MGEAIPADVLQSCIDADAVLLAAIGLPDVRKPDGTEVQPDMMMGLRRAMGLYAAVRPVKLYPGVCGPLNTASHGIDMVILRENLEGLFASFGGGCLLNDQVATDTILITREGTERITELAFRLAEGAKVDRPMANDVSPVLTRQMYFAVLHFSAKYFWKLLTDILRPNRMRSTWMQ